jgi:hypothetical protein
MVHSIVVKCDVVDVKCIAVRGGVKWGIAYD